jgi:hypothetical protein
VAVDGEANEPEGVRPVVRQSLGHWRWSPDFLGLVGLVSGVIAGGVVLALSFLLYQIQFQISSVC